MSMSDPDSFMAHLIELRDRLLRAVLAVGLVFLCLFYWAREIYHFLALPILGVLPAGVKMIATDITSPFFIQVKVTFMAALVVASPYVLYQAWAFVAPGLYIHEKRLIGPLVISSTILFLCGMAFAYFLVFPVVFGVMKTFTPEGVEWMPDISAYLNFALNMFFAFGVTFEVPIAVILVVRVGIVSLEKLREIRPYVIVGAFVVAAVVTPPDVASQVLLAVPLWLLYEVGLLVAAWMGKPTPQTTGNGSVL
jgi:sec-independent protein translocase protein TatC